MREWAMEQYEIRIVREGRAIRVYPSLQAAKLEPVAALRYE